MKFKHLDQSNISQNRSKNHDIDEELTKGLYRETIPKNAIKPIFANEIKIDVLDMDVIGP